MSLTPKQELFVAAYLRTLNATQAAIEAGYSPDTARSIGSENLTKPDVAEAIAAAQAKRMERLEISHDDVLRMLWGIASADTNELVEHRTGCCRHCHGDGHRYQFTLNEFARADAAHELRRIEAGRSDRTPDPGPMDPQGGIGFNPNLAPHPDCPECHGEGESRPIFKDTAKASPGAKALYAGFKLTKDGMEMKLHSKMDALEKIGRHIGFNAPQKVDVDSTVTHTLDGSFASEIATAVAAARVAVEDAVARAAQAAREATLELKP